jgi:uncharacterized protein (TIGR00725 family)
MKVRKRKKIVSVIGSASCNSEVFNMSVLLGEKICDSGFRIATGGLGGVMEAVLVGAHKSGNYTEGDTIGMLPGYDANLANDYVDIIIPSGLGFSRNALLVSMGSVIVSIAGGAGTLSELSLAYQLKKSVALFIPSGGWTKKINDCLFDGQYLDHKKKSVIKSFREIDPLLLFLKKESFSKNSYEPCWK